MLFMVVLDATSSRLLYCGASSWVRVKLIVCGPVLSCLFHFFFFIFLLCLRYILPTLCVCNFLMMFFKNVITMAVCFDFQSRVE
jgi:hypothetical protein